MNPTSPRSTPSTNPNFGRLVIVTLCVVTGCASSSATLRSSNIDIVSADAVANLEERLTRDAGADDVDVLAPKHFQQAQAATADAKSHLAEDPNSSEVRENVARAQVALNHAETQAATSRALLADIRTSRQNAVDADAGEKFPDELAAIDSRYLALAASIEDGASEVGANDRTELISGYGQLITRAGEAAQVATPKDRLQAINDDPAAALVPNAVQAAETAVRGLELLMREHPNDPGFPDSAATVDQALARAEASVQAAKDLAASHPNIPSAAVEPFLGVRDQISSEVADLVLEDEQLTVRMINLFPPDAVALPSKSRERVGVVARAIGDRFRDHVIAVEGYSRSKTGGRPDLRISESRAQSVAQILQSAKTDTGGADFKVAGKGALAIDNAAMSRRVDIVIQL